MTAVLGAQNLDDLYKIIHKALGRILNVDNFLIASHNMRENTISFPYFVDQMDSEIGSNVFPLTTTGSLTGEVIKQGKPLIFFLKDITNYLQKNTLSGKSRIGTKSKIWLGAPLKVKNRITGAIALQSYTKEDMYDKEDLAILDMISQYIAFALERKQTEDAIKNQKQTLEKIFQLSPSGIAVLENRVFKQVNDEFVKMLGYETREDFKDKSVEMIYASKKDYLKAGRIMFLDCATRKRSDFEFDFIRKDRSVFPAHITINYPSLTEPLSWTIASITDLTIRENIEKEKLKHEKLKGILEMAGTICHELNQPLHVILGYCDILLVDKEIDKKEVENILNIIIEQINRINRITNKLLSITEYKTLKYAGESQILDIWGSENQK